MIEIKTKGKLLTAKSKPYDFNGNSGTSYKVRVLTDSGEIFECNSSASQVSLLESHQGKTGDVVFALSAPKERTTLEVISFTPAK